ncbi:MAG: membrane protein insertase YidC [Myxococcales bacterium]|nr:membrane protein insertase YidC [Myxococcales bacterium]
MDDSTRQRLISTGVMLVFVAAAVIAVEYFAPKHAADSSPSASQTTHAQAGAAQTAHAQADAAPQPTAPDSGASATSAESGPAAPAAPEQSVADAPTISLDTPTMHYVFSTLNTGLVHAKVKGERFKDANGEPQEVVTTDQAQYLPLVPEVQGVNIPAGATWTARHDGPDAIVFTLETPTATLTRRIEPGKAAYQLWSTLRVDNHTDAPLDATLDYHLAHYVSKAAEKGPGIIGHRSPLMSHGICKFDDELTRETEEGMLAPAKLGPDVHFVALSNVYFATIIASDPEPAARCDLWASHRGGTPDKPDGTLLEARLVYPSVTIPPRGEHVFKATTYVGPKRFEALQAFGHGASEVVDLGWFSFIAKGLVELLRFIHAYVPNWGIAIILLTVIVKAVLWPLTAKSFSSMAKMRDLKPEMDRINELYADDREKKGAAIMELYRKNKINPLGGCLPSLLQTPIWFALYQSLSTNIELYHAPFALWLTDLSAPDPYWVLPLLLGVLMFIQQVLTPVAADPLQAKMMKFGMPAMITFFMLFLPAGLGLYMVTNSVLGIAQQKYIQVKMDHRAAATENATLS